ncbi:GroES-like protein [Pyrrhoderma noxium]|uniref:GroES-like protein n=1 Tax=Pyrrhoderma noxium TaxID=2282107 RepID=A0A286U9T4_9AGAM|nr:GroES-like protein [Pyrrhoderma noxium]
MTQQKALFIQELKGEWKVSTKAIPKAKPGELVVKVEATALNPIDWKVHDIDYFVNFVQEYPAILGSDSAGTVEEVGEGVKGFSKGDRVLHQGYFTNDTATFQQYTSVPASIVAKIPSNVTTNQAASIPVGAATAVIGLYSDKDRKQGAKVYTVPWTDTGKNAHKGESIVIFGGSSSVGQSVIQFAKLSGFSPIIVTASLHNTDLLKSLGATHVVDRSVSDVPAEIRKALGGSTTSLIFDTISLEETQTQAWSLLAHSGTLIITLQPQVDDTAEGETRNLVHVFGSVHTPESRPLGEDLYSNLTSLLENGSIKTNLVEVLPNGLSGIPDGLERLKQNKVSGLEPCCCEGTHVVVDFLQVDVKADEEVRSALFIQGSFYILNCPQLGRKVHQSSPCTPLKPSPIEALL